MLNQNDAKNILALLERVTIAAGEVDVYVATRNKLRAIAATPDAVAEHPETPLPGVTRGPVAVAGTNEA